MKLSNLLIVSSAFSLAVAGAAVSHAQKDDVLLRIVSDVDGVCTVFPDTMEENCALINAGPQCTVWYEDAGSADILPAYITPWSLPLCVLPLNRRF